MSTLCIGRNKEKQEFRDVLDKLISSDSNESNSNDRHIFLFDGYGGIGKTTLLKKLQEITTEEKYAGQINSIFIDWQEEKNKNIRLRLGTENIQPTTILDIVFEKFSKSFDLYKDCFKKYEENKTLLQKTREKIEKAEESSEELTSLNLDKQEWNIYHQPEELLVPKLSDGINKLVEEQNKSLVIFFDTYEIIGSRKCEDAVRSVIRGTNETIIWVIAGRFNLAKNTWRNEEVKLALFDILEKELKNHSADKKAEAANSDIVKAAIKSLAGYDPGLEVKQLIEFLWPLEKKHSDRFVRETAVRELGNLIDSNVRKEILLRAVEPIVQTLRKDDISQVRDAAKESLQQIYFVLDPIYKDKLNSSELPPEFILAKNTWERENSKEEEVNKFYQNILPSEVKLASNKSQMAELLTKFLHHDKDLDVRAAVARELGQQGSPTADTAIQKLIDALDYSNKNSDRYLREEAAKALSKLTPRVNIVDALNKSSRQDVISSVRQAAEEALKSIARKDNSIGKRAQRYLDLIAPNQRQPQETSVENSIITLETLSKIGNLSDEQVDKLIEAAQIVGNHPEPKFINDATQKLIKVLENKKQDPSVVAAVANSLGKIGNFRALECLLSKLEDIKSGDRVAREFVVTGLGNLQSKLSQEGQNAKLETVIDTLIDMWRNDAIKNVRNAVEPAIREIYKTTSNSIAYKALKRYPDYEKEDVAEFYEEFFKEFPLN